MTVVTATRRGLGRVRDARFDQALAQPALDRAGAILEQSAERCRPGVGEAHDPAGRDEDATIRVNPRITVDDESHGDGRLTATCTISRSSSSA